MGKLEYAIEIKVPPEKAFNFIADGTNSPKWHPSIKSTERISEGPLQTGSRLRVETVLSGRRFVWDQEVVEFTPGRSFRDRMIAGPFRRFEDWSIFERTETGTKWTFGLDYEPSGIAQRILDVLVIRRRVRQHHLDGMMRAKEILEK